MRRTPTNKHWRTDVPYPAYPKTPRLDKPMIVTEKIDGTNALLDIVHQDDVIVENVPKIVAQHGELCLFAGSRKRYVVPGDDNFGFASWVADHADDLAGQLGEGRHYGEWWGRGIQRGYGLDERRFSLFAVDRYPNLDPAGPAGLVPELYRGPFDTDEIAASLHVLLATGSRAAVGWDRPEGVVAYHTAARQPFKLTHDKD